MQRILIIVFLIILTVAQASGQEASHGRPRNRDMAIVVNFPEKPIKLPYYKGFWSFWARSFDFNKDNYARVGHTGVILVDGRSGHLEYYDFGRYDDRNDLMGPRPEFYGTVRSSRHVPELTLKLQANIENGWITNIDTILVHLGSKKLFKDYGLIEAAPVYHLNLDKMIRKAKVIEDVDYHLYGAPNRLYCTSFVRKVIRAGGGSFAFSVFTGTQTVKHVRKWWGKE